MMSSPGIWGGLSEVPPKTYQSTSLLPLASLPLLNNRTK
jgi:hypothetical protein